MEIDANDAVNQRVGRVSRLPWDAPGLICKQSFLRSADPPEPNLKTPRPEALASLLYQNIEAYAPRGSVLFPRNRRRTSPMAGSARPKFWAAVRSYSAWWLGSAVLCGASGRGVIPDISSKSEPPTRHRFERGHTHGQDRQRIRFDRNPRRAREQSQGRLARYPEAQDHRVHRRVGLGQVVAGVRHHRCREPAADQRDLSRLRPAVHAALRPARCGFARQHLGGHRRRPAAAGRQFALDRRDRHRHGADAARPLRARRRRRICRPTASIPTTTRAACAPNAKASGRWRRWT